MDYRVLQHVDEFEEAYHLEIAVWGIQPADAVPVNMLRAIQHGGGVLIGAYDERLVGIALAFPARCDGQWVLWSHMTGVDRAYQGSGIGVELKFKQRDWALANGYSEIRWTFDPLQRGNANFNLRHLGAVACNYQVNFYGVMQDEINRADLPSDRVEAIWHLRDPQVEQRASGDVPQLPLSNAPYLLKGIDQPHLAFLNASAPEYYVQIPHRLSALPDPNTLLEWRLALREALSSAFAHGYIAVDFTPQNAYLLRRS